MESRRHRSPRPRQHFRHSLLVARSILLDYHNEPCRAAPDRALP